MEKFAIFEVLAVLLNVPVFFDVMLCRLVGCFQRLGGSLCFRHFENYLPTDTAYHARTFEF